MNLHAVEESFDNYNAATRPAGSAVKVEQFGALSKGRRELVLWRCSIHRPACVGDQVAGLIVNRNHHSSRQKSTPGIIADSEQPRGCERDAAACYIRMERIGPKQPEPEHAIARARLIHASFHRAPKRWPS